MYPFPLLGSSTLSYWQAALMPPNQRLLTLEQQFKVKWKDHTFDPKEKRQLWQREIESLQIVKFICHCFRNEQRTRSELNSPSMCK